MPGTLTPTEVFEAWTAGVDLVKVFPAGAVGGANYIKVLSGPLLQVPLVPTGVSLETAADFIRAGAAALGVGGDFVDLEAIRKGQDHVISDRATQFVEAVREARARIWLVGEASPNVTGSA
jgi:2-dehydro-3-deoxyphosphogluconate aldolase/(4S)-4-hydroxy-2-oxoglutarate aldolase